MARSHRQLTYGVLGPGATQDYTVPVDKKLVLSSVLVSSNTVIGVPCNWSVQLNPGASGPKFLRGQVSEAGPGVYEPWATILPSDVLRVKNEGSGGAPNLEFILSGIVYDLP